MSTVDYSISYLTEKKGQVILDEVSADLTYIGFSEPGTAGSDAKWVIVKIETVGTVTTTTYATAFRDVNNVWDDRAGLTYTI